MRHKICARCRFRSNFTSQERSWLQNGHSKTLRRLCIRFTVTCGLRLLFFLPISMSLSRRMLTILLHAQMSRFSRGRRWLLLLLLVISQGKGQEWVNLDSVLHTRQSTSYIHRAVRWELNRDRPIESGRSRARAYHGLPWSRSLDTCGIRSCRRWLCDRWRETTRDDERGEEDLRHLQFHFARAIVRTKRTGKRESQCFDTLLFRWWLAFRFAFTHGSADRILQGRNTTDEEEEEKRMTMSHCWSTWTIFIVRNVKEHYSCSSIRTERNRWRAAFRLMNRCSSFAEHSPPILHRVDERKFRPRVAEDERHPPKRFLSCQVKWNSDRFSPINVVFQHGRR